MPVAREAPRAKKLKKKTYTPPSSRSDAAQRTGARTPKPKPVLGPPSPAGPPTNRVLAKKNVVKDVKRERARLKVDTNVRKDRDTADLVGELRTLRQIEARRGSSYLGLLHPTEHFDKQTGKKIDAMSPRSPHQFVARESEIRKAAAAAPVLKVLEQTTRPLHGIAGGVDAALKGKNVPKAVGRGLANKDKTTFSNVLKTVGAPKVVQTTVGTVADIFLDPTTYATFGAGSLAKKAAVDAAKSAQKKALAKGLTPAQAQRFAERAAKQAAKKAPDRSGLTVKFAGKEVPGIRRMTAKVNVKAPRTLRKAGSEVNPRIAVPGLTKTEHAEIRQAARSARAATSSGLTEAQSRAAALRDKIGPQNYTRVIDAIEAGKVKTLPDELREAAVFFRSQMRHARRLERRAGINVPNRRNYVPHVPVKEADEIKGVRPSKTVKPGYAKGRKDQRTLREIRQASMTPKVPKARMGGLVVTPGKSQTHYVEDIPTLYSKRMSESAVNRGKSEFNQRIASLGTTIKRGHTVALRPREAIYHVNGPNLRRVEPGEREIQRLVDTGDSGKGGRYVVLNEDAIDHAYKTLVPQSERSALGAGVDKVQGLWKWMATQPNPGFHIRNLAGDTANAYLGQAGHKLPANVRHSARTLRAVGRREEAQRTTLKATPARTAGTKIDGKHTTYEDLAREAEKVGAIRSGFVSKEIPELRSDPSKVKVRKAPKAGRVANRVLKNREDLMRLATYIAARKEGRTAEQAAAKMADFHFDYADLSPLERTTLRRIMPFYTFSARNIPLQFRSVLQKPGKFAQYQKIREETAKAFGIDLDAAEEDMAEYEQRAAPLTIKWKGKAFTLSLGPSGLPMTDLNEFPTTADPSVLADEWMNRGMSLVTPLIKTPVELWSNISFFFRDQIERETGPLVSAPSLVTAFPEPLKKELGIVPDFVDRRTGKKGWGWPAKVDYVSNILPGPFTYLNKVLTPSERKQQTFGAKTLAYVGVKAAPIEPIETKIQKLYEERSEVGKKLATLRQRQHPLNNRPIRADNPTPEYSKLLRRYGQLDDELGAKRVQRGDVLVPRRGAPSRSTSTSSSRSTSSGGFLGGSSGGSGAPSGGFLGGKSSSSGGGAPSGGFLSR